MLGIDHPHAYTSIMPLRAIQKPRQSKSHRFQLRVSETKPNQVQRLPAPPLLIHLRPNDVAVSCTARANLGNKPNLAQASWRH